MQVMFISEVLRVMQMKGETGQMLEELLQCK